LRRKRPDPKDLRSRAEEWLRSRKAAAPAGPKDDLRTVHELQVHEIELELQNEELRETRQALEVALARQTELFDFAPVGYFALGTLGEVVQVNFAGARLLDLDRSRVTGRRFSEFVSLRDVQAWDEFAAGLRNDPDQVLPMRTIELALASRHGAVLARVTAPTASPGSAVLLAVEDVTARRRAEEALREELHRRDEFLAILSHELRNPLAPIRNGLYLLQHAAAGSETARRALRIVDRQVSHLTRIVDDLLDVTRIARGKLELRREVADLSELVQRTVEDHRGAFDEAGVALHLLVADGPSFANVDATRIVQILGNLLANSRKFTPRGGRVDVELGPNGHLHRLAVRDTGAGIAPDILARLFQPFSQGPQTLARSAGGLGLGLATVRGLVELHGGTVAIDSPGERQGTVVVVSLPRAAAPRGNSDAAARGQGAPHRVLVIDDNEDAASTLKDLLEIRGHSVRTAGDAPSGLAAARDFRPEVVLCDIGLPGPDGYTVARALRADRALCAAWLIALSGYALPGDVERSLEAGFDRHVAKPTSLDQLEALFAEAPVAAPTATPVPSGR
jgi:two-component system CheB/CheR fusion protein